MKNNQNENIKTPSKLKIFGSAVLGYIVFNLTKSAVNLIAVLISYLVVKIFGGGYIVSRVFEANLYIGIYLGYSFCKSIGNKLIKSTDSMRKYMLTVGILFVINYIIFLIDYFLFKEQSLFNIIVSLLLGIVLIVLNLKEKDYDY